MSSRRTQAYRAASSGLRLEIVPSSLLHVLRVLGEPATAARRFSDSSTGFCIRNPCVLSSVCWLLRWCRLRSSNFATEHMRHRHQTPSLLLLPPSPLSFPEAASVRQNTQRKRPETHPRQIDAELQQQKRAKTQTISQPSPDPSLNRVHVLLLCACVCVVGSVLPAAAAAAARVLCADVVPCALCPCCCCTVDLSMLALLLLNIVVKWLMFVLVGSAMAHFATVSCTLSVNWFFSIVM